MSKEPKNLLRVDLILNYYKDDITERYTRNLSNNIVMDNDILYVTNEKVYITTLEKHCELQQKINKVLESIKDYKEMGYSKYDENEIEIELIDKILEIVNGGENNR